MTNGLPQSNEEAWALAGAWSAARQMSPFEALMWRVEADPRLRSTMTVVDLLDRAPDWDRLVAAHDWASRLVPRFRQRVVEPPLGLGLPAWVADELDLGFHVRRVRVPEPGGLRELLDVVQADAMAPFDRSRPPWRASLVEGLQGDRAAYVLKLHHSITDGQGGTQLLGLLHSRRREPSPDKPMPARPAPESASGTRVLAEQVAAAVWSAPSSAVRSAAAALTAAQRVARRPTDAVGDAAGFARSLQRVLAPPPARPSPLLANRSRSWRFDAIDVALADLKAAGRAAGGSLNDAYIATLLGGFRRYHEHLGEPIEALPMAMPISLRGGDHPMGGNRFAGARFAAPVGEPDPGERIRLVHDFVLEARDEPALDVLGLAAPVLNLLPLGVVTRWYGAQTTRLDLQASNVAGLPYPAYIAGARIERMLPFGPLPGCAVMATVLSYAGTCSIGLNVDPAAVTDPELFTRCVTEGLDEVLALAAAGGGQAGSAGPRRLATR